MDIRAKLTELAEASLLNSSQFIVDVIASARNLSKITVIVDGDQGVTIGDCSLISRELGKKLDELDLGNSNYVLEVSTPGLDHPLKLNRQFQKNVGRGLKVHRKDKSIVLGKLAVVDPGSIRLKMESREGKTVIDQELLIPFDEIEKAFVMVSFK
jgi:ribosome maturation factor RimP